MDGVTGDVASAAGQRADAFSPGRGRLDGGPDRAAAGAGASRSLRFENASARPREDEFVRVQSAGCTTGCGPQDVYRIRAWETTLLPAALQQLGTQITVLVVQNPRAAP